MRKILGLGINKFLIPGNDLQECVADAHAMVIVGADLGCDSTLLLDNGALKKNWFGYMELRLAEANAGDLTYLGLSWSGHGTHVDLPDDGLCEALCCYDIAEKDGDWDPDTIITAKEFKNMMNQFPPSCIVEVWLDTCFSKGMTRAMGHSLAGYTNKALHHPSNTAGQFRVANPDAKMHSTLNSNIIVWCATSELQEAADAPDLGHGAFTYYWLNAFNKDQKSIRADLIWMTRARIKAGYDQVPRLVCWNKPAQGITGS